MRKSFLLLLLTLLFILTGSYLFLYYRSGDICFKTPVCTQSMKTLCHPKRLEVWQGPGLCSCGFDATTLLNQGWTECEVPEHYQGKITRDPSVFMELPEIKIPENLSLFVIPITLLTVGIGVILILWIKQNT